MSDLCSVFFHLDLVPLCSAYPTHRLDFTLDLTGEQKQPGQPVKEINIIMDNCAGQNKNRVTLQLAPYLIKLGYFGRVDFIFYVVGHTENPADRLFYLAKKALQKTNVYTMDQFLERCGEHELVTSVWAIKSDFFVL
jgi:hypothetical protein